MGISCGLIKDTVTVENYGANVGSLEIHMFYLTGEQEIRTFSVVA